MILHVRATEKNFGNWVAAEGVRRNLPACRSVDFRDVTRRDLDDCRAVVCGGGGWLTAYAEPFWRDLAESRAEHVILWGLGMCEGRRSTKPLDPAVFRGVASRLTLAAVRDDWTRDHLGIDNLEILFCPACLFWEDRQSVGSALLHVWHKQLLPAAKRGRLLGRMLTITHGEPRRRILATYARAGLVVASRYHGAICAHSLGLPHVLINRDVKFQAYAAQWDGGPFVLIDELDELEAAIERCRGMNRQRVDLGPNLDFAGRVNGLLAELG